MIKEWEVNLGKKVELLSPAGNYEAFMGALNAGADGVYLGGEKFGARAYADNFTTEEICRALHVAHFMGRKVYLTVNTLLKDRETAGLYDYLRPFYAAGLDGVIVQDLGVFSLIREWFPGLALHVSTQMTVTGPGAAAFLKEQGAVRIVPARELSLAEVRTMKEKTDIEIECFIHGAMCYCYSGQCLFSSILGGRSGNRGRCAQPCRLPYQIYADQEQVLGESYPLSLKDMCTLAYIPQLIEAGIDSFKIEGRMKQPEYAAGVTAIYRKYIDRYYGQGAEEYRVEPEDMDRLRGLYIRSEIQTGYYERHNGKEMVTLSKPGYSGSDARVIEEIRENYLHEPDKMPVRLSVEVRAGEPMRICVTGTDTQAQIQTQIQITGDVAQAAQNAPLRAGDVRKQMLKTGNSCVAVSDCQIHIEGDVFVPVRALNQLRRDAIEAYENQVICGNGLCDRRMLPEDRSTEQAQTTGGETPQEQKNAFHKVTVKSYEKNSRLTESIMKTPAIECLVTTYGQFAAVADYGCGRIFIESDLFLREYERIISLMGAPPIGRDGDRSENRSYYLALPPILRLRDADYLQRLTQRLEESDGKVSGFLLRNLEGLSYVSHLRGDYAVIPDTGLYCFNQETLKFWKDYGREYTLPYELNAGEAFHLVQSAQGLGMRTILVVYGRIPMMVTANCLRKTSGICPPRREERRQIYLKDRYQTSFPVAVNCEHCYNIIYNSVPYSLHTSDKETKRVGADVWRYDFVLEPEAECRQILAGAFPSSGFTTGHLKRGVE